jgi:hypothetical protein
MKSKVQLLLIAVLSLCLMGTWTVYSQRRQSQQWEYKIAEYQRAPWAEPAINKLAADGWELVTIEGVINSDAHLYLFKRQLSSK